MTNPWLDAAAQCRMPLLVLDHAGAVEALDGGGEAEDGDEGGGDGQLREQDGVHLAHEAGADDLVREGGAEAVGEDHVHG